MLPIRAMALGAAVAACAFAVGSLAHAATPTDPPAKWRATPVLTKPVALGVERVGALRFAGGLELHAPDGAFGGISGLDVRSDNTFLGVSDAGAWVAGQIVVDAKSGALRDVTNVTIAPMLDEHGAPPRSKTAADAEGLTLLGGDRAAVSFEQTQTIRVYSLAKGTQAGADAPTVAAPGPALTGVRDLSPNQGLEALAAFGKGERLVVGSERGDERGARIWTPEIGATAVAAPIAHLSLDEDYGLVGCDQLPNGDFVALERSYSPARGVRIRVLRIAASALRADDGNVRAETLADLAPPLPLDNFEGVAAVPGAQGGVRLYLISDDNFSPLERTLLYAFDIVKREAEPAKP